MVCDQLISNEWLDELDRLVSKDPNYHWVNGPPLWCNPDARAHLDDELVEKAISLFEAVFPFDVGQYKFSGTLEMSDGLDEITIETPFEVTKSELDRLEQAKLFFPVAYAPSITERCPKIGDGVIRRHFEVV